MAQLKTPTGLRAILVVILSVTATYGQGSDEKTDPVLQFYVEQAGKAFTDMKRQIREIRYTFLAKSYYEKIGKHGVVERRDSVISRYYCIGDKVDSAQVMVNSKAGIPDLIFSLPDLFNADYVYNFFPNDVGGPLLAIGFDTKSAEDSLPTGILVIDREKYDLKQLFLRFPEPKGFKRLTRSFLFAEQDGVVFPDSIWEVGARQGVFTTDYYRFETNISEVEFDR